LVETRGLVCSKSEKLTFGRGSQANFSGTVALASLKGDHVAKTLPKILLNVAQDGDSLEIVESFG